MRVHVIGAGIVGLATGRAFTRFGHDIYYSDNNPAAKNKLTKQELENWVNLDAMFDMRMHFVCVPETAVEEVVKGLGQKKGAIIIRSTVPPGTTERLTQESGRPIYHVPEFLREATAEDDVLFAEYVIIGKPNYYGYIHDMYEQDLHTLYESMNKRVIKCTSTESELVKLITNNHLATLISFWNEVKLLCDKLQVNSHRVANLVTLDTRVSKYGALKHGAAYGGACLPKDVKQMLAFAHTTLATTGGDPLTPLLYAVQDINKWYGGE